MNETPVVKPDSSSPQEKHPVMPPDDTAIELLPNGITATDASVGDYLRLAREKAGLSLGDVASRLRMGVKQVRALEQNDYLALPKGTFLRGFVRNFAKEVGVKPEQALDLLEATHQSAAAVSASAVVIPLQQNIKVPSPGGEHATPRGRIATVAVIAGLLLTVVWWWWEYVRPYRADGGRPRAVAVDKSIDLPTTVPEPVVNVVPADAAPAPIAGAAPQAAAQIELRLPPVAASTPVVSVAPTEKSLSSPPAPAAPAGVRVGSGLLGLTFSDKSWVQVVDANGKTVLDRTFKGGDAEEVSGRAPFTVIVGNAQATRLAYNGKEIDLVPHTRASVARLTVK